MRWKMVGKSKRRRPSRISPPSRVARQRVAIDLLHLRKRHQMRDRIEVVEIRQQVAAGVPDLPVRLDHPLQDLSADAQLLAEVAHRDPQPQRLGAALLDHLLRQDGVAERLRHLPAVDVDQEAVGEHFAERRPSARAEADEQRALEPAAMLIAAFEVHVGRPRQIVAEGQHGLVARPGIEPDVENVALALERSAAARGQVKPGVMNSSMGRSYHASAPCSSNTEAARSTSSAVRIASPHFVQSTAGNRHAPRALARDAPVGPVREHVEDAIGAPRRDPLDVPIDGLEAGLPQRVGEVRPSRPPIDGSPSMRMNHCDVARKITGLWHRQQCGYECAKSCRCQSRARSFSASSIRGLASNTLWPPKSSTVSRNWPPGPTGA